MAPVPPWLRPCIQAMCHVVIHAIAQITLCITGTIIFVLYDVITFLTTYQSILVVQLM